MQKIKYFIAASSLVAVFSSSSLYAAELEVVVDDIKQIKGSLYISLYNTEQSFQSNQNALKRQKISVNTTPVSLKFNDLPAGEYAVKTYQDINENGKIDFGSSGMPSEPYGSSSKSKELAPPSYMDAKFTLDKNQTIHIHLLGNQ